MMKIFLQFRLILLIVFFIAFSSCQQRKYSDTSETKGKYSYRGWNLLSNHHENGLKTLDAAAKYGINHIDLSHYQLCHDLKDLKNEKKRKDVNFLIDEAHRRGIEDVYVWDHAFYGLEYYPDRFKLASREEQDFTHHTKQFQGGINRQLNLDDPEFWQWVYNDYDTLLSYAPGLNGVVLTFIETGSYVIYQHSEKLKSGGEKLAALVDSLGNYFIDKKGLKLTIRTFIYNQFEKDNILEALHRIQRTDITVMMKMVPHDWFMTYPYQDYVAEIPFPVVIEYDCGMEYAGENIIANSFPDYFANAFKHYNQFENIIGYSARVDRYEETSALGTPGELNLDIISRLAKDPALKTEDITDEYLIRKYGEKALPYLKKAFNSAYDFVMSTMYTLGNHTANHSRLNFHRQTIYSSHTTGEWYSPDNQMRFLGHGVNKEFHNYKDVINVLSFPKYKTDTAAMRKDLAWVIDSAWLDPGEMMSMEYLNYIIAEKNYGVKLAQEMLENVEKAIPFIEDPSDANKLFHTFNRSVIFAKERRGAASAVYGYRLWCKGKEHQTSELRSIILSGLIETEAMLDSIDNYPVHVPLGQWRWTRDRESFNIYEKAMLQTGWKEMELYDIVPTNEP